MEEHGFRFHVSGSRTSTLSASPPPAAPRLSRQRARQKPRVLSRGEMGKGTERTGVRRDSQFPPPAGGRGPGGGWKSTVSGFTFQVPGPPPSPLRHLRQLRASPASGRGKNRALPGGEMGKGTERTGVRRDSQFPPPAGGRGPGGGWKSTVSGFTFQVPGPPPSPLRHLRQLRASPASGRGKNRASSLVVRWAKGPNEPGSGGTANSPLPPAGGGQGEGGRARFQVSRFRFQDLHPLRFATSGSSAPLPPAGEAKTAPSLVVRWGKRPNEPGSGGTANSPLPPAGGGQGEGGRARFQVSRFRFQDLHPLRFATSGSSAPLPPAGEAKPRVLPRGGQGRVTDQCKVKRDACS